MSVKVDLKDRRILFELDRDSRQPNKRIAKRVGLSEQAVGNRIRRLQEKGVIEYFYVKTNPAIIGYMHVKVYLRFHNLTQERELLADLRAQRNILWLASLRGKFDLVASIYVRDIADFTQRYEEIFGKWSAQILERDIVVLEQGFTYTKAHLLPEQEPERIVYSVGANGRVELDDADAALLRILNTDARASAVEIAARLGERADTLRRRIVRLQEQGVITGFGVKIDYRKLANRYHIVSLKLQNMDLSRYAQLEELARANPNVVIFLRSIGDHDAEIEIETTRNEELDGVLRLLREHLVAQIKEYDILEVTREHRLTYFPF